MLPDVQFHAPSVRSSLDPQARMTAVVVVFVSGISATHETPPASLIADRSPLHCRFHPQRPPTV